MTTRFSLRLDNEPADGTGRPNPSPQTKILGANGDREIFIFSAQLTTKRIGNLIWLIDSAICVDYTYINTCILKHLGSINEESHGLKNVPRTCIV